jgi:Xaa-Pro aminopeptidase
VTELEIHALVEAVFRAEGMDPSYGSIVTVRGEVLHGHATSTPMAPTQLLLVDAGAEALSGYASDVTRTWPVSGTFTPRQREVYETVLEAQEAAISLCRPGVRYRDVHLAACRVIARALLDWGLLRGSVDGLVEQGAHAVFFPHGVGHLIGLDVHDMELFGDRAGYAPGRERADQFGLGYLRLDRDLEAGIAVTIEPGIYLVPAILRDQALRARLGDAVDWARAESWLPFGGIRIEDDVLVTDGEPEILTPDIPKKAAAVEALVGSGLPPRERLR